MIRFLYRKLFPGKWQKSPAYRQEQAEKYDSKILKYVTERFPEGDRVLCKDSYICVKAGFVYVNSETASIAKFDWFEVESGELMSHDGVIFTGYDQIQERERSIICYFKYYR